MNPSSFDHIAKLFATHRTRRQAIAQAGPGLAAGALAATGLTPTARAQEATPAPADPGDKTMFLFLQSFQSGSLAPVVGAEDRYTLTLDQGMGQTIYFSDRPERLVGAVPTPRFLAGLGFLPDNPPNAALVVETADGQTEIAVVELFTPAYDEATHTATYEVAVLEEWEDALGVGLTQTPNDLAAFGDRFGAAHLFIDDCPDGLLVCEQFDQNGNLMGQGMAIRPVGACWNWGSACCQPCSGGMDANYWKDQCYQRFPGVLLGQELPALMES